MAPYHRRGSKFWWSVWTKPTAAVYTHPFSKTFRLLLLLEGKNVFHEARQKKNQFNKCISISNITLNYLTLLLRSLPPPPKIIQVSKPFSLIIPKLSGFFTLKYTPIWASLTQLSQKKKKCWNLFHENFAQSAQTCTLLFCVFHICCWNSFASVSNSPTTTISTSDECFKKYIKNTVLKPVSPKFCKCTLCCCVFFTFAVEMYLPQSVTLPPPPPPPQTKS